MFSNIVGSMNDINSAMLTSHTPFSAFRAPVLYALPLFILLVLFIVYLFLFKND